MERNVVCVIDSEIPSVRYYHVVGQPHGRNLSPSFPNWITCVRSRSDSVLAFFFFFMCLSTLLYIYEGSKAKCYLRFTSYE
jgi:hypothetical protein